MKIAFAYSYSTFGGCERVMLERVRILNSLPYVEKVGLYFEHLRSSFFDYLIRQSSTLYEFSKFELIQSESKLSNYDLVFSLDYQFKNYSGISIYENHSLYSLAFDRALRQKRLVVPSNTQSKKLRESGFTGEIQVLPNSLKLGWMKPMHKYNVVLPAEYNKGNIFLIISRLDEEKLKYFKVMLEIANHVEDASFLFIGPYSSTNNSSNLLRRIIELHEAPKIFLGEKDFAFVDEFLIELSLKSKQVFSLTLSKVETFNLAHLSAKMCNIPTIGPSDSIHIENEVDFTYDTNSHRLNSEIQSGVTTKTSGNMVDFYSNDEKFLLAWEELLSTLKFM